MRVAGFRRRVLSDRRVRSLSSSCGGLSELDVQHFASIVGEGNVITDAAAMEVYNTDWMGAYRGRSKLALRP